MTFSPGQKVLISHHPHIIKEPAIIISPAANGYIAQLYNQNIEISHWSKAQENYIVLSYHEDLGPAYWFSIDSISHLRKENLKII